MLDTEALYQAVEDARWERHLSRKQAAQALGVSVAAYGLWGRGGGISADVAVRISKWLDRDLRDFVKQPG